MIYKGKSIKLSIKTKTYFLVDLEEDMSINDYEEEDPSFTADEILENSSEVAGFMVDGKYYENWKKLDIENSLEEAKEIIDHLEELCKK